MLLRRYGEREQFLVTFNPSYQMKVCGNAEECFFGDYPTLGQLKGYGNNAPMLWLIPQLQNLSEYCGVKEKLTQTQLAELSFIISNEYYYFKISELMLFVYRFKAAKYGTFYGMVDPLVITKALKEFARERTEAYERRDKEIRERKMEEDRQKDITYEEYCKLKGR